MKAPQSEEQHLSYYQRNRARIIERSRQWALANPEKRKAQQRAGAKRRRAKITEYQRRWRAANPGVLSKYAANAREYKRHWYLARLAAAGKSPRVKKSREELLAAGRARYLRNHGGQLKRLPPSSDPTVRHERRRSATRRWQSRHNWKVLRRARRNDSGLSATAAGRARKAASDRRSHARHRLERNAATRIRSYGVRGPIPAQLMAATLEYIKVQQYIRGLEHDKDRVEI